MFLLLVFIQPTLLLTSNPSDQQIEAYRYSYFDLSNLQKALRDLSQIEVGSNSCQTVVQLFGHQLRIDIALETVLKERIVNETTWDVELTRNLHTCELGKQQLYQDDDMVSFIEVRFQRFFS